MDLDLFRMVEDATKTLGRLEVHETHEQLCVTIERAWVDADHNGKRDTDVSRFKAGDFVFKRVNSPTHGVCFEGQNIPDIKNAQIHIACLPRDLKGCIGVGLNFGPVQYPDMAKSEPGVQHSHDAFKAFMKRMEGVSQFTLHVHDVPSSEARAA